MLAPQLPLLTLLRRSLVSGAVVSAWTLNGLVLPAIALDFESGHERPFEVDTPTVLEFEFVESHGAYQSNFGVMDVETGDRTVLFAPKRASDIPGNPFAPSTYLDDYGGGEDFLGSPGVTVDRALVEFILQPNRPYTFFLESTYQGRDAGTVYFLDLLNPNGERLAVVERNTDDGGNEEDEEDECADEGVMLFWDDTGSVLVEASEQDRDFDDYILQIIEECPIVGVGLPPAPIAAVPAAVAAASGGGGLAGLSALGILPPIILAATSGDDSDSGDDPPSNNPPPPGPPGVVTPTGQPPGVFDPPTSQQVPFNFHPGFSLLALAGLWWIRRRRSL